MKQILFASLLLIAASSVVLGQRETRIQNRVTTNDEEALKELVKQWADAVVHFDAAKLEKIQDENFNGNANGMSFDKKMLLTALRSGRMKVAAWTVDEMKVSVRGNSAEIKGRSTLSNATYMGQDFSGEYEWVDRFVKQRDGNWRAVTSHAQKVKK